jgi:hypothetical protein
MAGLLTDIPALCANGLLSGVGKHLSQTTGPLVALVHVGPASLATGSRRGVQQLHPWEGGMRPGAGGMLAANPGRRHHPITGAVVVSPAQCCASGRVRSPANGIRRPVLGRCSLGWGHAPQIADATCGSGHGRTR